MRFLGIALFALVLGCRPSAGAFETPGVLRQALARVTELTASAELVPSGGAPLDGQALEPAEDQTSFAGFVEASPGEYTLEIVFRGRFDGSEPLFLGRWTSNTFTVVSGDAVAPVFSTPLDTVGRPGDGGDDDNDGLGLLDELLFGSDPALPDTDSDGIEDGEDCRPTESSVVVALRRGQLEDCDGDGELRPDRPVGTAGRDCDDEDPTVHPAATDICSDGIDQDCNPATCPDESRPVVEVLEPTPNEAVGCSKRVLARITSGTPLTMTEVRFLDAGTNVVDKFTLRAVGMSRFESPPLNDTSVYLDPGPHRYAVFAQDMRGASTTSTQTMDLVFEVPVATMTPMTIGRRDTSFDITVSGSATRGIASIVLFRAPVVDDEVLMVNAVEVASIGGDTLTYTVDPSTLPDGQHAFVPVVTDSVGNELAADDDFIPDQRPDGTLGSDATYLCLFESGEDNVPVRILDVGAPVLAAATMRVHLAEAITLAAQRDPAAVPVEIRGFGIQPNGQVPLDESTGGGGKWWRYVFFNFAADRRVEVTWFSLADRTDSPVVEVTENDPFGFSFAPFMDLSAVEDSDVIAAAYTAAAGCEPLAGNENDDLRYQNDDPFSTNDVVLVNGGATSWKATATTPITEISSCQ